MQKVTFFPFLMEIILKKSRKGCIKTRSTPASFSPVAAKWAISDETKKPPKTFETSDESSPKKSEQINNF